MSAFEKGYHAGLNGASALANPHNHPCANAGLEHAWERGRIKALTELSEAKRSKVSTSITAAYFKPIARAFNQS